MSESAETIADLRDAIRLIIGREIDVPWYDVPQREVDGYLEAIRRLKARRPGRHPSDVSGNYPEV